MCTALYACRPAGAPIRGFGGVSQGSAPLIELMGSIPATLDPLIGKPLSVTAIVDIMNKVGCRRFYLARFLPHPAIRPFHALLRERWGVTCRSVADWFATTLRFFRQREDLLRGVSRQL